MPGLNLTREEATERASVISSVTRYEISLDLTRGDTDFGSFTRIEFDAREGASTFADLVSNNVHSITLNGAALDPFSAHQDNRIALENLAEHNVLEVDASCQYMHTGEGLHRFVDPADGQAYTYSQFEVPDARRVYTTFEQPDLKSVFTLTVKAPKGWKVFSNAPTPSPEEEGDAWIYRFATTEKMSTYITAIVAGPYEGTTASLTSSDGRTIDLGVYARASIIEHLDADEIIEITRQGFEFFEGAYGIAYPFTKYDQIFVPEYNAGAMENAGCVTFRDAYVFRTRPTEAQMEARANTILHELAHMWFGDLVTMKWWNDLWLVEVNFDGITYAKGASVLRQLVSYVGRDAFFAGLHEYLTKHSYANATLEDLLSELAAASGRDLASWSKVWLEEAGVTLLRPVVSVSAEGTIERLEVTQEAFSEGASLRPHRMGVAGYSLSEEGTLTQVFREELDVDGASTVIEAASGIARPDFILVNDGDLGYAKVRLDEQSLSFAIANITKFTDSLTRGVVMASAWDMTRDGEMPARDYLNLALTSIPVEDNMSLLMLTLRHIDEAVRTFVAPQFRAEAAEDTGRRLLLLARTAASGSDAQRMLVAAAARNATSAEQFEAIRGLYDGTQTLDGLDLDVDLKWDLLISLVRGDTATEEDIAAMEASDDTMTGHQNAAACRAARSGEWIKADVWDKVLSDTSIPNDTRWAMISGFWAQARTTPSAYVGYVGEYFEALAGIWERFTFHTAEDLTTLLFPTSLAGYAPDVDVVAAGHAWIEAHAEASAGTLRIIRELIDVCERQIANQAVDAG